MKLITLSKIGYNHPSQANWSYWIWKVDLIDTTQPYCMSYTVRETFGGDSRFREALTVAGIPTIETKGVFECPKITGVAKMQDIENKDFINEIINWYSKN